jgi:uncharacterized SAM-binding protein YcdF (DUF218 family)
VKRAIRFAGVAALALVVACALFFTQILAALGSFLEKSESPQPAGAVFVLAGDPSGNRILKAAMLVREGYAPEVIVSGPQQSVYGFYESDLAIAFAEKAGYPKSYFIRFPSHALSTRDEASAAAAEFHRLALKRVILVTSDYHTRRAGNLFRAAAPDIAFVVVAAPDLHFTPRGWWRDREGRKTFLLEWMKTIAGWMHI